jgi:hypothetical protein
MVVRDLGVDMWGGMRYLAVEGSTGVGPGERPGRHDGSFPANGSSDGATLGSCQFASSGCKAGSSSR